MVYYVYISVYTSRGSLSEMIIGYLLRSVFSFLQPNSYSYFILTILIIILFRG